MNVVFCGLRRRQNRWFAWLGVLSVFTAPQPAWAVGRTTPQSSNLFSAEATTASIHQVNAWQAANPWQPVDRNWIRATYYTGVMAAHEATGDSAYLEQALRWAGQSEWQPGTEASGANVLTCGQTYLQLFFLRTNRAFIEPLIAWLDSGRSNTPAGAKVWYLENGRRYADSLYVGPPTLAMLARATGDPKHLDWMNACYWDVHAELFDRDEGLFYRDHRFRGATNLHGKKIIWSRGNGWVFAGLPRILDQLAKNDPGRSKFEALFKQMAASLASRQRPDGLWRPNLADPDEFSMPESSGTAFFCYGLAWGVRNRLLDRDVFLPVVKRAWTGLVSCVNAEGKIEWGQLVGDRPVAVKREDSHEYVTGAFLLAASEVLKLAKEGVIAVAPEKPSP
jgi:rhamnogalacturonyl hydrolase YesR